MCPRDDELLRTHILFRKLFFIHTPSQDAMTDAELLQRAEHLRLQAAFVVPAVWFAWAFGTNMEYQIHKMLTHVLYILFYFFSLVQTHTDTHCGVMVSGKCE
jgi:hypothetical protein